METQDFNEAAQELAKEFEKAYLENVRKALSCGGLDTESELNYGTLKAIALITAESFVDSRHKESMKTLKNLRCFL